ncbi:MAG: hypothetical protein JJU34_20630 [Lunatimonas sp.]|uniref:hypothetical protein n=1 Tax=Lunatimonas sp. TaxID=2060141 RepID=UPI00263B6CE7|nr:hypothetical protein [Lunatimonas sp.]MCC5939699.1 hypothetical protein [Lunatimonas sp.]
MKRKGILVVGLLVFVVGVYYLLGGFAPLEIEMSTCEDFRLTGLYYQGTPQDEALGDTFRSVEGLISNHAGSFLHTIYEVEPAGKLDTMRVFVGTVLPSHEEGFEWMSVSCREAIVATIRAHRFVMPSPLSVKAQIQSFADEQGLELSGVFIDRLQGASEVSVWAPLAIEE